MSEQTRYRNVMHHRQYPLDVFLLQTYSYNVRTLSGMCYDLLCRLVLSIFLYHVCLAVSSNLNIITTFRWQHCCNFRNRLLFPTSLLLFIILAALLLESLIDIVTRSDLTHLTTAERNRPYTSTRVIQFGVKIYFPNAIFLSSQTALAL
jgi:hypothetical protein